MTRLLDDRCLKNFMATFESRNLRVAAENVGLTQPAMSKSLARLEDDLGVILFSRLKNGLAPTPAATELYDCARRIETETRRSLVRIAGLEKQLRGDIRIGAGPMWSWIHMPEVISNFLAEFPRIEVNLITAPMHLLLEQLESGQIDIAVGEITDLKIPKGLRQHKFEPTLQWPFVRPDHPLAAMANVSLADVVTFPWIGFFNNGVFNRTIAEACAAEGLEMPEIPLLTTSLASTMAFALKGNYVVILPHEFSAIAKQFGLSRLRSRSVKMWKMQTALVCHEDEFEQSSMFRLIELMKNASALQTTSGSA